MSKNQKATLTLVIKEVGSAAIGTVKKSIESVVPATKMLITGLLAVGAAAVKFTEIAGRYEGVERSFKNLAASQGQDAKKMLDQMKTLSQGTVSDLALMEKANNALLLGLPVDKFGDMLRIAKASATATGQSMDFMLNSIVTGLGRGSKLMIDNLGIVFNIEQANKEYAATLGKTADKLTEAEKKQALINKTLEVGLKNVEKMGDAQLTASQKLDILKASAENTAVIIGQAATPAVKFFSDKLITMFDGIRSATSQNLLVDFFKETAKVATIVWNVIELFGQNLGVVAAGIANTVQNLLSGKFIGGGAPLVDMMNQIGENAKAHALKTGQELDEIDKAYSDARVQRLADEEAAKIQIKTEAQAQKVEFDQAAWDEEQALLFERKASELDLIGASEAEKLAYVQKSLDAQLKAATTMAQKKKIFEAKEQVLEMQRQEKMKVYEQAQREQKLRDFQSTLSQISTLQNSHNKTLATIGKAAAIAQITINTAQGIGVAWGMGPILGPVLAPLVAIAGAAQIAQVAGVQLAQGGIVPATPGGIQATIGEGGRSEAVIPLPDDFDPDNGLGGQGVVVNFHGPVMGDASQAREFAKMIDEQLLELRRNNQSLAFDQGFV